MTRRLHGPRSSGHGASEASHAGLRSHHRRERPGRKPLALRFAAAKKRVVLVERNVLGGTCINTGCTPTKTMIASARAAHVARTSARLGVHAEHGDGLAGGGRRSQGRRGRKVARAHRASRWPRPACSVVHGQGRFVGEREIEVERRAIPRTHRRARRRRARRPSRPSPASKDVPWLDNASVMQPARASRRTSSCSAVATSAARWDRCSAASAPRSPSCTRASTSSAARTPTSRRRSRAYSATRGSR